jgi:hypothetical protein
MVLAGGQGDGQVVWPGRGGDDGSGRVEDGVDDDVEAFTGPGWADQEDGVFD